MPAGGGGGAPDLTHQQVEPQGYATGRPRRRQQPPVAGRHGPAYQVVAGHRVAVVVALQLCGLVAAGVAAVGLEAEAVVTVAEEEGGGPAVLVGRTLGENAGYSHGLAEVHLQPLVAVRGSGQSRFSFTPCPTDWASKFKVLHPVLQTGGIEIQGFTRWPPDWASRFKVLYVGLQTGHPDLRFYTLSYRVGIQIQGFIRWPTDWASIFKVLYAGLQTGHSYSRFYTLAYRLGIHIQGFTPCPTYRTSRFKVLYTGLYSRLQNQGFILWLTFWTVQNQGFILWPTFWTVSTLLSKRQLVELLAPSLFVHLPTCLLFACLPSCLSGRCQLHTLPAPG